MQKVSIFLLFTVLLMACKDKFETTYPTEEKITESVYASGFVIRKNQYQVYAKNNGILKKIWVKEGDLVKAGQVLFTLSNDVSHLNKDNAQLAANYADYSNNQDKVNELNLTIEMARKKMENDLSLFNRQKKLWEEQIGTRFELEQKELAYTNAKLTYQSAQLRLKELRKQLKFSSEQSKKNLSVSKTMLDDYNVKSEANGSIFSILKEKGEMVSPQMTLATIGDAKDFVLKLQIDENDIVLIQPGQKIMVSMDSYQGEVFEAVVQSINPFMNEKTRSFEAEAVFTKQPERLYPNLTLEANIIIHEKGKALTIPRNFLQDDGTVYISKKEKRKIKTGLKDFQKVEILEGLTKDEQIFIPK